MCGQIFRLIDQSELEKLPFLSIQGFLKIFNLVVFSKISKKVSKL